MGLKNMLKRAVSSMAQEAKEKMPRVAGEMAQQILEVAPLWDQGYAQRAQGNRQAEEIHKAVSQEQKAAPQESKVEQKLESIDMHMAALTKSNYELLELQKERVRKIEPPKKTRPPRRRSR